MDIRKHLCFRLSTLAVLFLAAGWATVPPTSSGQVTRKPVKAEPALPPVSPETLARIEAGFVRVPTSAIPSRVVNHVEVPELKVPAFLLAKYEVTQEDWVAVMGYNPSAEQDDPKLPVTKVSWHDAHRFIDRLNAAKGVSVFRLPTAAEWEAACRAGAMGRVPATATESTLSQVAWWGKNSGDRTHPVGRLKPNAFGFYDMLGNVEEWCETAQDEKARDKLRVTAGGHFNDENLVGDDCSTTSWQSDWGHDRWTGFRLAKDAAPAKKK